MTGTWPGFGLRQYLVLSHGPLTSLDAIAKPSPRPNAEALRRIGSSDDESIRLL